MPASPGAMAVGPDGNIWFVEAGMKVASFTP
jgi:streptogramin lyase